MVKDLFFEKEKLSIGRVSFFIIFLISIAFLIRALIEWKSLPDLGLLQILIISLLGYVTGTKVVNRGEDVNKIHKDRSDRN